LKRKILVTVFSAAAVLCYAAGGLPFGRAEPPAAITAYASEAPGEGLTYNYSEDNTVLEITGTGAIPDKQFQYKKSLKKVIIGDGVTAIGNSAFYQCTSLEEVIIGNGVTSIGEKAFSNDENISSLTMGSSVKTIGDYAFYWCTKLKAVELGEEVTSVGKYAFSWCTSLGTLSVKNGKLGNYAFNHCSSLSSVTMGAGVQSIGEGTFGDCDTLENVTIGSGVETIGKSAFEDCDTLKSVVIGNKVTTIGDRAFYRAPLLENVDMGSAVESIGEEAFYYCIKLKQISIGADVSSIGDRAFCGCSKLSSVTIAANSKLASVGDSTFSECTSLSGIAIPGSVTEISSKAFFNCQALKNVSFGANSKLASVGDSAFSGCTSLSGIAIPDSVTEISSKAFFNCQDLENVSFGANSKLASVGNGAFSGCTSLSGIAIPDSVTEISSEAFNECQALENVSFGANSKLETIGSWCFYKCRNLSEIRFPATISSIGTEAFYLSNNITDVYLTTDPDGLKWEDGGCDDFMSSRNTKAHVPADCLSDYIKYFKESVNVTFVGDLPSLSGMTLVEAVEPTCVEEGNIEYYIDETAAGKRYYTDRNRENELTFEQTVLPKDDSKHVWGLTILAKKSDTDPTIVKRCTCTRCGKILDTPYNENDPTYIVTIPATIRIDSSGKAAASMSISFRNINTEWNQTDAEENGIWYLGKAVAVRLVEVNGKSINEETQFSLNTGDDHTASIECDLKVRRMVYDPVTSQYSPLVYSPFDQEYASFPIMSGYIDVSSLVYYQDDSVDLLFDLDDDSGVKAGNYSGTLTFEISIEDIRSGPSVDPGYS